MGVCNDGLVLCDSCAGLRWDPATYVELWPRWRHDPGYHVCLDCLRREHEQRYLGQIRRLDALARRFGDDTGKAA